MPYHNQQFQQISSRIIFISHQIRQKSCNQMAMISLYNFLSDPSVAPYKSHDFCYVPQTPAATHQPWNCIILYNFYDYVLYYLSRDRLYISVVFVVKSTSIHSFIVKTRCGTCNLSLSFKLSLTWVQRSQLLCLDTLIIVSIYLCRCGTWCNMNNRIIIVFVNSSAKYLVGIYL